MCMASSRQWGITKGLQWQKALARSQFKNRLVPNIYLWSWLSEAQTVFPVRQKLLWVHQSCFIFLWAHRLCCISCHPCSQVGPHNWVLSHGIWAKVIHTSTRPGLQNFPCNPPPPVLCPFLSWKGKTTKARGRGPSRRKEPGSLKYCVEHIPPPISLDWDGCDWEVFC